MYDIAQTVEFFRDTLSPYTPGHAMSLSLFAAESLVRDFLNGRALPTALHVAVVRAVEARLVGGLIPVLDETLCQAMDGAATAPPPWSVESVLQAARERCNQLRRASDAMGARHAT
ncbi:hypothetical protein [Variovorax sp. JS1663]|uniref:hypothetical protein n=1 Tax=Variovorax sp. JS1663 TaxID=1851577 RepID=UPI0011807B67|nr:hypothetical protein [Variovorax sp. JS1663]